MSESPLAQGRMLIFRHIIMLRHLCKPLLIAGSSHESSCIPALIHVLRPAGSSVCVKFLSLPFDAADQRAEWRQEDDLCY